MERARSDFFVSYTSVDEGWAEWIAHTLEEAGYTVVIQAWDFRPGSNFVLEMQTALTSCERLIAVLSPEYLNARYPQPEWAAVFAADPEGADRRLIPVMVKPCTPNGLLSQVVQIRIHGLDVSAAAQKLIDGVKTGRAKPTTPPAFPGPAATAHPIGGGVAMAWRAVAPAEVAWRMDLDHRLPNQSGYEAVEVHLVPTDDRARLQMRDIAELSMILPGFGRQRGLFSTVEELDATSDTSRALVTTRARGRVAGIAVTRTGQRSIWTGLPRDTLGAILDETDLAQQLTTFLRILSELPIPDGGLLVPAVGIEPAAMLSIGTVAALPRSTAQFGHAMSQNLRPAAEDALDLATIAARPDDVAGELAARLIAEYKSVNRIG